MRLNLMASAGAGKTSLIERTIEALGEEMRMGAIEGDLATSLDADMKGRKIYPRAFLSESVKRSL
ncbi:MAG: GTP-binding protein [Anaerolineae bacterium]